MVFVAVYGILTTVSTNSGILCEISIKQKEEKRKKRMEGQRDGLETSLASHDNAKMTKHTLCLYDTMTWMKGVERRN